MSAVAAAVRTQEGLTQAIQETGLELQSFSEQVYAEKWTDIWKVFRLRDILISQFVYMKAMQDYIEHGGKSRGSALYADKDGVLPMEGMPEFLRFSLDNDQLSGQIQEVLYRNGECAFTWRKVRQIPMEDDFFENVWRQYRENKSIAK